MHSSNYSAENVRKGVFHYLLGRGVAGLAGFATVLLLVRYMDVQNYAGYTALSGLTTMCGIVASLGLERAIARYIPEGQMQRSKSELASLIWKTALIRFFASSIITIFIFTFWEGVNQAFGYIDLGGFPLQLAIFIIAETLFQHFSSVFQALMMQKVLTRLLAIQWLGRLLLMALVLTINDLISLRDALWIFALPEAVGVVIFVTVLQYYLKQASDIESCGTSAEKTIWPLWRPVLNMAMHNYGFSLLAAPPQGYFMRMIIAITLPVETVAAYGFFQSLAEKVRQYIPMHFFYGMIEPLMMARYLKDADFSILSHRCHVLYKTNLLLLVPAAAWIAVAGPYISSALTGGKFEGLSWILLLVVLQLMIGSHVLVLQLILNAIGKSRLLLKASLYALLGFSFFAIAAGFVAKIGILFAPLLFSVIVNSLVVFNLNNQGYSYRPSWSMLHGMVLLGCAVGGVAALGLSVFKPTESAFVVAGLSGGGVLLAFVVGVYFFSIVDNEDIGLVRNIVFKKKDRIL